jgi:hypothetical protein
MARLRSTVHIYRGVLSHSFKGASKPLFRCRIYRGSSYSARYLRCQLLFTEAFNQSQADTLVHMHTS